MTRLAETLAGPWTAEDQRRLDEFLAPEPAGLWLEALKGGDGAGPDQGDPMITHHCDDCGSEITSDCCPDHPEADILSVGPYMAQEPGFGGLYDYKTGAYLRQATAAEAAESAAEAASDIGGGSGVIDVDGIGLCYVA